MEWVTTTGRSLAEAKERALDQLGVAEDDAEFEILDEPRPGLFGRVRGEARVRARVRPTQPRPKADRRDRRRTKRQEGEGEASTSETASGGVPNPLPTGEGDEVRSEGPARGGQRRTRATTKVVAEQSQTADREAELDDAEPVSDEVGDLEAGEQGDRAPGSGAKRRRRGGRGRGARPRTSSEGAADEALPDDQDSDIETTRERAGSTQQEDPVDAQQVGEEARSFVQGLVDAFGLQGTTSLVVEGDDLELAVAGSDLGLLVGPRGTTLQAVQELARVAAQRRHGDHDTRLRVDVGGYRVRRREALTRFALDQAAQVVAEGTARALEPMSSSDRKVIHDALSDHDGVVTRSEGDDPQRRVVIAPARD